MLMKSFSKLKRFQSLSTGHRLRDDSLQWMTPDILRIIKQKDQALKKF